MTPRDNRKKLGPRSVILCRSFVWSVLQGLNHFTHAQKKHAGYASLISSVSPPKKNKDAVTCRASPSLTGPLTTPRVIEVPEGDAGLSVLGSAFLMAPGVCVHPSFGSLISHNKASIIITLREQYRTGSDDVACPAWTITRHLHSRPSMMALTWL